MASWFNSFDHPVVIIELVRAKQIVVNACRVAQSRGIRPGMTLGQAKALCADVLDFPHQPERDRKALDSLGRAMMRFTPVVHVEAPDALLLDVTGCERLFHGYENLITQVNAALRKWKIAANCTIAPTAAGAWAIATCSRPGWQIVSAAQLDGALDPLPVGALRVEPEVVEKLQRVGIDTIGMLRRLPRDTLPSRFGPTLLDRLARALGEMPESFAPVDRSDQIRASIEFEYSVDSLEIVWEIVRELLDRVIVDLTQRGSGARQLLLRFYHYHGQPIEQLVRLARPSRDPKNLFNLIRCALESIQTDEGFTRIDLDVPAYEKVTLRQITMHDRELADAWLEWSSLVERLQVRLGADAVLRPRWSESHLPESACAFQPATADGSKNEALAVHDIKPLSARPLCLLRRPIEIGVIVSPSDDREGAPISFAHGGEVHHVALCVGPERITGPWWEGNDKTRDYFIVENAGGERFWLFRVIETWKWYLHGKFE